MKFRLTLPKDEQFFQRYAGLVPTISKLSYVAQAVSALTEIGILAALIGNAVKNLLPPAAAFIASLIGAILGTAFIEIGLRKFLPFSFRQILNKRFAGLDLVMSIAIFAVSVLLLCASGYLSFEGSKDTVGVVMPPAEIEAYDNAVYLSNLESIEAAFTRDSTAIAARYAAQIAAADAAHHAAQDARKTRLRAVEEKERNQGNSYATQKATIRQEIADAAAAHTSAVAALMAEQAKELQARQAVKDKDQATSRKAEDDRYQAIAGRNAQAIERRDRNVSKWGGGVAYFTIICLAVLLLAIGLQEVHRHGAKIEEEALPNEFYFRQSPFSAFMAAVSERMNTYIFTLIKRIEDGTPEPPEPGKPSTVYEYEAKVERRPIGFKTDDNETRKRGDKGASKDGGTSVAYETRIMDKSKLKNCIHCGGEFMPNHKVQKYCSEGCRIQAWEVRHGRKPYLKKGGRP